MKSIVDMFKGIRTRDVRTAYLDAEDNFNEEVIISPFEVKEKPEEVVSGEDTSSSSGRVIEFPEKDRHGINSLSASSYEDEDTPKFILTSRKDPEEEDAVEESEDEDIEKFEDDELGRAIHERLRAYR